VKTRLLSAGLVAALFLAAQAGAGGDDWKTFTWEAGKCSALLPGTPKAQKQSTKLPDGSVLDIYMQLVDKGNRAYILSYLDIAALKAANEDAIQKALDNGRDQAAANLGGKVVSDMKRKLETFPGREIHIDAPGLGLYRARMYVVRGRLYQIVVLGPRDVALSKESTRYLDSLKLTK
jgi:hypothetical protein